MKDKRRHFLNKMKFDFSEESVISLMKVAGKEKSYEYPWKELENDIRKKDSKKIVVLGYGSLVNKESAMYTLNEKVLDTFLPVIAFGVKRLFNYIIPDNISRYNNTKKNNERAALNVKLTRDLYDVMNGVAMELSSDDIQSMRERELGYDLIPIPCIYWNEEKKEPFLAYILSCEDENENEIKRIDDNIMPHRHYYSICRNGAEEFGEEFLNVWLETTFLADAKTPVIAWETQNIKN